MGEMKMVWIKSTLALFLLSVATSAAFLYSGVYPMGADAPHSAATYWALETLREEMKKVGKSSQFEILKGSLTGEDDQPRDEVAEKLNMTESAVKVAVHRLRQRYRKLLRDVIAETVSNEEDLDDELRYLVTVLRKK